MIENTQLFFDLLPSAGLKLAVAVACGLILGLERERRDKPAGLRTIVLITVGSTLFMIVSGLIAVVTEGPSAITRVDPSRVASQVVTGIGFLGAGTIMQARGSVQGLTTAAVIWVAAGIGLCIGVGFPLMALVFTLAVLAVLTLLDPLRNWLTQYGPAHELSFLAPNDSLRLSHIEQAFRRFEVPSEALSFEPNGNDTVRVHVVYSISENANDRLLLALSQIAGVRGTPRFE